MPCLPVSGNNMGMFTVPSDRCRRVGRVRARRHRLPGVDGRLLRERRGALAVAQGAARHQRHHAADRRATTASSSATRPGGGILIQTAGGAKISVTDSGITISTGQGATLSLQGNTVDVNSGALTVR